jgi:hypothetical protein
MDFSYDSFIFFLLIIVITQLYLGCRSLKGSYRATLWATRLYLAQVPFIDLSFIQYFFNIGLGFIIGSNCGLRDLFWLKGGAHVTFQLNFSIPWPLEFNNLNFLAENSAGIGINIIALILYFYGRKILKRVKV